ncbi:hypothetical protein ACX3P1_16180 [Mesorhizobium sp. A623]
MTGARGRSEQGQICAKLTGKSIQTQAREAGSGRHRRLFGDNTAETAFGGIRPAFKPGR